MPSKHLLYSCASQTGEGGLRQVLIDIHMERQASNNEYLY